MADESKIITKSGFYRYQLTLGNQIGKSSPGTMKLVQGISVLMDNSDDKSKYYVTLRGVKVNKKIYQPTEIEAEVDFVLKTNDTSGKDSTNVPSFEAATSLFMRREVELEILESDKPLISGDNIISDIEKKVHAHKVAVSCFVYEVFPKLKCDTNGKKMYVKLNIFSMDKLMTINKYSKAYVARKLGSGILKPESLNFGKKADGTTPLIKTNKNGLRFLKYIESDTSTDTNGNSTKTNIGTEFIQPYLVQYNESFYDFLVRTANRCGEFLYFENGQLTLGLPDSQAVTIDKYASITEHGMSPDPMTITPYSFDSMKNGKGEMGDLNYKAIDKLPTGFPKDAFPKNATSNSELAHDEYFFPLEKDKFTTFKRECNSDINATNVTLWRLIPLMKTVFTSDDGITGLVSWAIGTEALNVLKAYFNKNTVDTEGYEAWIAPYEKTDDQYDSKAQKSVMFGSANEKCWTTIDFYNNILKNEEEQQRKIVCVDMGTNYINLQLGEKVKIDGLEKDYVIIQVEETSEESWDNDYEQYDTASSDQSKGSRSLKFFAIPSYKDENGKEQFIPPLQKEPRIRKVGPQSAFVTDNVDPKFQGRVRVAYPWQSLQGADGAKLEEASQKLKVATDNKKELEDRKKALNALLIKLLAELEEVKAFVNASKDDREALVQTKDGEISGLEDHIKQLVDALISAENSKKQLESDIKKGNLTELDLNTKKSEILAYENSIQAKEKDIEQKKAKLKDLKALRQLMIDAAAEHDQKTKDNDPDYQDIEEDNTVIAALLQKYNQTTVEYQDCYTLLEEKEAKVSKSEKEVETIQAIIEESVKAMSSPWIRVATPMATDGGGTYFRPNVGDEVLINYDNDNIERPYVVGSLFSKNVLDPVERVQRKANPLIQQQDVSMSLTSRNGHHITFTDPDTGGSFITNFLSPGLGFITSLVGLDQFGENVRDLAGGIHMGDRYNINEIEMVTHRRELNIRSQLGTITLSAFKGITVDAPNADVTIKGMNINLIAGNKVNIISGDNIKPPTIDDPEGKGAYIGALLVNTVIGGGVGVGGSLFIGDTVDFSTIRRMVEIFVRPVDGTMLIKSKRYLMLEAGPGHATVKADRYKNLAVKKQGLFSKLISGTKPTEDKETMEEFYKSLILCIDYINNTITEFGQVYNNRWIKAKKASINYLDVIPALDKDAPNIESKMWNNMFKEWDESWINYRSPAYWKDTSFTAGSKEYCTPEEKFGYFKDKIIDYAKATHELFQYGSDITILFHDAHVEVPEKFSWIVTDCLKKCIKPLNNSIYEKWCEFYESDKGKISIWPLVPPKDIFQKDNLKVVKRKAILSFLYLVNNHKENAGNKFIKIGLDMDYVNKTNSYRQEHYWQRQVNTIDHFIQRSKFWRMLYDGTVDLFVSKFHSNFQSLDQDVWESTKDGQILFSENEGSTVNFNGTQLEEQSRANIGTMDNLKKVLMAIK